MNLLLEIINNFTGDEINLSLITHIRQLTPSPLRDSILVPIIVFNCLVDRHEA